MAVAHAALRLRPTPVCMPGAEVGVPDEQILAMSAKFAALTAETLGPGARPRGDVEAAQLDALEQLWMCRLEPAAAALDRAARLQRDAGDARGAAWSALQALERRSFPGGRAADLALATFGDGALESRAALEEAAAAGQGEYARRARELEAGLAAWEKAFAEVAADAELAAMAAWFRAVAALRLLRSGRWRPGGRTGSTRRGWCRPWRPPRTEASRSSRGCAGCSTA
jgi:hypothetical protein